MSKIWWWCIVMAKIRGSVNEVRSQKSEAVRPRDDASRKRSDPATTPVAREC
ncbi:MAG: hypothetical protein F6K48_18130 [Okeania sp. SIO3H1]|nr:hypothetical protein [Okeania sp. SIO3H1]